jgi:predicted nucleic acid-binding Zn ribbon protein
MADRQQTRSGSNSEQRKRRIQQLVFNALAIIIILSWILTLLVN